MTIGERIRYYRKNADMTQRELAATTGIHYVSICNYESGKMIPREDQIKVILPSIILIQIREGSRHSVISLNF